MSEEREPTMREVMAAITALRGEVRDGFAGVTTDLAAVHADVAEVKVGVQECVQAINATHEDVTGLGTEVHAHISDDLRHARRRA